MIQMIEMHEIKNKNSFFVKHRCADNSLARKMPLRREAEHIYSDTPLLLPTAFQVQIKELFKFIQKTKRSAL